MQIAVGALFFARDTSRCLFLLRSERQINTWGLAGGRQESGETVLQTLHRECQEELGAVPEYHKLIPLETFTSENQQFRYITFVAVVDREFQPTLNQEHHGYCWVKIGSHPTPLHPGLWNTLNLPAIRKKIQVIGQCFPQATCQVHSQQ